jgi:pilus assembly protein Flp/PilA
MPTWMKELVADQSGATAVEYGLIVSLIVIAVMGAIISVATTTIDMWDRVETESVAAMGGN